MDLALVIKVVIGLVVFAAWIAGKFKASAGQPAPIAVPPPLPRRVRRIRNAPPRVEEESAPPAPVTAVHLDASSLVVTRPARALSRSQFRGAAALRQAIVAREVLGPPLCLRPPRF